MLLKNLRAFLLMPLFCNYIIKYEIIIVLLLLQVLGPQLNPMTDQQSLDVFNLEHSCQQAEDALSQGVERLQQMLAETVAAGQPSEGSCNQQMTNAMEKLEALMSFVAQVCIAFSHGQTNSDIVADFLLLSLCTSLFSEISIKIHKVLPCQLCKARMQSISL